MYVFCRFFVLSCVEMPVDVYVCVYEVNSFWVVTKVCVPVESGQVRNEKSRLSFLSVAMGVDGCSRDWGMKGEERRDGWSRRRLRLRAKAQNATIQ